MFISVSKTSHANSNLGIGDYTTSIEELMQSLHQIVLSGKVLYLGVSDTPAWVVAKANQYARCHGFPQFV